MKKLLSLPPNLVECFHDIMHADHKEWFCTSDPVGKKLGSGGGTAWLLNACREEEDKDAALGDWLAREKRIPLSHNNIIRIYIIHCDTYIIKCI